MDSLARGNDFGERDRREETGERRQETLPSLLFLSVQEVRNARGRSDRRSQDA